MNVEYVLVDLISKRVSKTTHTLQSKNELSDLFESLDAANALLQKVVVASAPSATTTPNAHDKTIIVFFNGVSARVPMVQEEQASSRVKEILKLSKTNLTDGVQEEQKQGRWMVPSKKLVLAGYGATASLASLLALYQYRKLEKKYLSTLTEEEKQSFAKQRKVARLKLFGFDKLFEYEKQENEFWLNLTTDVEQQRKMFAEEFAKAKTDNQNTNLTPQLGEDLNDLITKRIEANTKFIQLSANVCNKINELKKDFDKLFTKIFKTVAVLQQFNEIVLPLKTILMDTNFEILKNYAYTDIDRLFQQTSSQPNNQQTRNNKYLQIIGKFKTKTFDFCNNGSPDGLDFFIIKESAIDEMKQHFENLDAQLLSAPTRH